MLVMPPPPELLLSKDLLVGVELVSALREPVALRERNLHIRAIGISTSAEIVAIEIEPVEPLTALDIGL